MKKFFDLQNSHRLIHLFSLGILLTGIWAKLFPLGNAIYSDPFHHGEFVASLPFVLAGNINFFTIHGAMDWLPAWISHEIWGAHSYFLPTMLIHTSLDALASLFLYFVIALLTGRDNKYRAVILMISAVSAIYLVGGRDLFLVLTIFLYFLCERSSFQWGRNLLEITLGVSLAVNLFWSFDRGIAGIAGIGLACAILVIAERRYIISIASFAISIWILHWIDVLSFANYLDNFKFLLATSSQWRYGYTKFMPVFLTALVAIPNGWAIYYLGKQFHQNSRTDWRKTASLLLLAVSTILMFKIGTNRADNQHVIMTLWMPALAYLYLQEEYRGKLSMLASGTIIISMVWLALIVDYKWLFLGALVPAIYVIQTRYPKFTGGLILPKLVGFALGVILLFSNIHIISSNYSQNGYLWMSQLSAPPTNRSLVSKSIQWVSAEMLRAGSHCVFDLSNNGVINGVTGLPACTKYTYPVYATQRYEADMLEQLQQQNPPVVVFSSTFWSFKIDGKSMHDRFPALKDYLVKTYPYEKCDFGYCLRYINQPG